MSKESRKYRDVEEFLSKVGISKISNLDATLVRAIGKESARHFLDEFDRLNNNRENQERERYSSDSTELHDLLMSDMMISRIVESFYDAEIIRECCKWVFDHKEAIGDTALDIGCGSGVITCFAAMIRPDVSFLGIDRSKASIDRAVELASSLELDNIEFRFDEIPEEMRFSTVFSFRTVHENIGFKTIETRYLPFDEQVAYYKGLYKDYVSDICSCVNQLGNVISVERFSMDTDFYGLLCDFNEKGLGYNNDAKEVTCREANFEKKTRLVAFVLDRSVECNDLDLFEKWSSQAFNQDEENDNYTEAQADYYLQKHSDGLIMGYETFDHCGTKSAKCGLYRVNDNPDVFIMYQSNAEQKRFTVYPMERLDEAKKLFSRDMTRDDFGGFKVTRL